MENNIGDKINDIDRSINATYLSIISNGLSLIYYNGQKQALISGTAMPKCISNLDAFTNLLALVISEYFYCDAKDSVVKGIKEGQLKPQDYLEYISDTLVLIADIISVISDAVYGPDVQSAGEAVAAEAGA
jgi:hypothetical protein